jgi:hypothetical protein
MIIDLDARDGEWFSFFGSKMNEKGETVYDDPLPDAGRIQIRSLVPYFEANRSKQKRKHEFVLNPQTRQMERVSYYDEPGMEATQKERDDAWDYCITGIENVFDAQGNAIECTRENKLKLMMIPPFNRFVARCLELLSEVGVKTKEEERKNA